MKLEDFIRQAIEQIVGKGVDFTVEHPADETHGDYASNIAMVMGGNPRQKAEEVKTKLQENEELLKVIERIEIAGPGFINFWLKKSWLLSQMSKIDENYGKGNWGRGRRLLVDYSSPNIAKDFSVGHLRSTIIGQTIRNLYEFCGWETIGDNHLGDWGTQFGMIIAAVEEADLDIEKMSVAEMEELYVKFNERVKEDETLREKAKQAFVRLEKGNSRARAIWRKSVETSIREFDKIYDILGVKIEHAYGESFYEGLMGEVIKEVKSKKLAYESEGALVMDTGKGLPPGMLLKSDGGTTYFTRDLAAIKYRQGNLGLKSDLYVYEVGADQIIHFKQLFLAVERLGWAKKEQFVHVPHGLVLGSDGKRMSTRKGTGTKMEVWLRGAVKKAGEINKESAQKVGVGAVKYFDLKHAPSTSYKFDMQEALSLDGNSGPYLQYGLVRCKSVLEKANNLPSGRCPVGELNEEELRVLRWLYRFPETIDAAARNFSPNLLCNYLFELTQRFNGFYNKHRILDEKSLTSEVRVFRLGLTKAVGQVLTSGLKILGIEAPAEM